MEGFWVVLFAFFFGAILELFPFSGERFCIFASVFGGILGLFRFFVGSCGGEVLSFCRKKFGGFFRKPPFLEKNLSGTNTWSPFRAPAQRRSSYWWWALLQIIRLHFHSLVIIFRSFFCFRFRFPREWLAINVATKVWQKRIHSCGPTVAEVAKKKPVQNSFGETLGRFRSAILWRRFLENSRKFFRRKVDLFRIAASANFCDSFARLVNSFRRGLGIRPATSRGSSGRI